MCLSFQVALNMVAKKGDEVNFAAVKQYTYWKTLRTVVHPPEQLNVLFLISLNHCNFYHNRELDCIDGMLVYGVANCHHLSYVRTSEELERKMSSFSHADEVYGTWLEDKWRAWDRNNR